MKAQALKFGPAQLKYSEIIGTGGIGSGKFFRINGNHTLGREESRSGQFLNVRDYCKQHIILHYIKVLLGPDFQVTPIGKVGNDDIGNDLLGYMTSTGFVMDHIEKIQDASTLFSFCFHYPDGSGGNFTTDNSASSMVNVQSILDAEQRLKKAGSKGMIMAAAEVPLTTRQKLLQCGKDHGLFCAASFTSEEITWALESGVIAYIDLIAINMDEAKALASYDPLVAKESQIVTAAIQRLQAINKKINVSITAGNLGSCCWDGKNLNQFPAIKADVKSTAGAGDAFCAGLLCGVAIGLSFFEAQQLATIIAGFSVTSPHTIHPEINRISLKDFIQHSNIQLSEKITKLLED
jgi:ribokinase